MSIPSNFTVVEQQILSVDASGEQVQFANNNPPAGISINDGYIFNGGSKACQVAIGSTRTLATAVKDGSADGTNQIKIGAGMGIFVRLGGNSWIGAITETGDVTTLYCHRGFGQ